MSVEIIKSILDWNPWFEEEFPKKLLGFKREINIIKYLDFKEIKIIEGPRRVGKSTLMYQVIYEIFKKNKNVLYLNFDDEVLNKYPLSKVFETFLEKRDVEYLFIDEIQNCPEWTHFIRKLYDTKSLKQIWISGSNSNLIKQEYSSLLTGRNINLKIHTLNFREYLNFKNIKFDLKLLSSKKKIEIKRAFNNYIKFGAFPEVVLREVSQKELLINYYEDFLYKDIVSRYNVNSLKLKNLGLYLNSNSSKLVSYRNLAKTLNLNYNSVVDYINYFLEVYLFDFLYKYDVSIKKQLSNEKKIYSIDIGLANSVSFRFSEDMGRLLENLVFIELKRRKKEIYYHRAKKECDFIIKEGLKIVAAVQVCSEVGGERFEVGGENKTKKREIEGLVEAMKTYNLKEGLILTEDEEFLIENGEWGLEPCDKNSLIKIRVMPIWKWLLLEQQ